MTIFFRTVVNLRFSETALDVSMQYGHQCRPEIFGYFAWKQYVVSIFKIQEA